jgi:hypothetical protein
LCSGAMKRALSHVATVSVPAEPNAGFAPACCDYRKDGMTVRGDSSSRLPQHPLASTQMGMMQQPPAYSSGFRMAPHACGAWQGFDDGLPTNVVPGGSFRLNGGGFVAFDDDEFTSTGPGEGSPEAMRPRSASAYDTTDYSRPFTTSAPEIRSSTGVGLDHNAGGIGASHGGTAAAAAAAAAAVEQQDWHTPEERRSVTFAPSPRTNLSPSSRPCSGRSPPTQHFSPRFESLSRKFLSLPLSLPLPLHLSLSHSLTLSLSHSLYVHINFATQRWEKSISQQSHRGNLSNHSLARSCIHSGTHPPTISPPHPLFSIPSHLSHAPASLPP